MQQASRLKRNNESKASGFPHQGVSPKFANINNDLLFLLSFHDKRIFQLMGMRKSPRNAIVFPFSLFNKSMHLRYDNPLPVDSSFSMRRKLETLEIVSTKKFYLRSLNRTCIKTLVCDSIHDISSENAENISVGVLVLKNMKISSEALIGFLRVCKPAGLTLERVSCSSVSFGELWKIYEYIENLKILSFDVADSFVDFSSFRYIVRSSGIVQYSYSNGQPLALYKIRTANLRKCFIHRDYIAISEEDLESVECLYISSTDCIGYLAHTTKRLKYLNVKNSTVDAGIIKNIGAIRGLSLTNCCFKTVAFYELINNLAKSLRYISFNMTELPLDGVFYMKRMLSHCEVVLSGTKSFIV